MRRRDARVDRDRAVRAPPRRMRRRRVLRRNDRNNSGPHADASDAGSSLRPGIRALRSFAPPRCWQADGHAAIEDRALGPKSCAGRGGRVTVDRAKLMTMSFARASQERPSRARRAGRTCPRGPSRARAGRRRSTTSIRRSVHDFTDFSPNHSKARSRDGSSAESVLERSGVVEDSNSRGRTDRWMGSLPGGREPSRSRRRSSRTSSPTR